MQRRAESAWMFCLAGLLAVTACSGDGAADAGAFDAAVRTFQLCPNEIFLGVVPPSTDEPAGVKFDARVLVVGGTDISWSTFNFNIATASGDDVNGLVTAVSPGETTVAATRGSDGKQAFVKVNVGTYPADSHMRGTLLYEERPCSGCHDNPGQSNVTSSGVSDNTDDQVKASITQGIKPEGGMLDAIPETEQIDPHLGALINGTKPILAGDQLTDMVSFLRSIRTRRPPEMDACR